jgi:hypothetical protein
MNNVDLQPKDDKEWLKDYVAKIRVRYLYNEKLKCETNIQSLDVNDHIDQIILLVNDLPEEQRSNGWIDVLYIGKRIFAGNGPRYSRESILKIASIKAEIGQDIYCMCNSERE